MALEVSVVVATHARPRYLERALRSVLAQTHPAREIIVVDDNAGLPSARAQTTALIASLRAELPAGTSLIHRILPESLGGAGARNRGAGEATGEYLAFLDDDDWWLPEKLEKQVAAFETASLS